MTVIVNPAHASVAADYAVFDVIHFISGFIGNLLLNRIKHLAKIVRVNKPVKGVSGKLGKLFHIGTAENTEY